MAPTTNKTLPGQKEAEMLQCLQGGEQRYFSKVYEYYSGALYGLILKWVRDTEIAENLLQDVFLKAWRSRDLYDASKGKVFTWLYNITRHICIDYLRSKAFKKSKASVLSEDMSVLMPGLQTGNIIPDAIGLRKLVNTLKKEEKELIELMYFKGLTQRQIADLMNIPLGTIKTRMTRAIKNLRLFFNNDWDNATGNVSLI